MSLNLNVKNYINSISQSLDDNPIETLKNNPIQFEHILSDIEKDMSQLVGSLTPTPPLDELVNSILKLDTIIRTCSCIEDAVSGSAKLEEFKEKEFKLYVSSLERLGIKGADKKDYKEQLEEIVRLVKAHLISENSALDAEDADGHKMLYKACFEGNLEKVKLLVSLGSDITQLDSDGLTYLHLAIDKGHTDLAKLLIAKEAGLTIQDKNENTPLILAIDKGNIEIAKLLIAKEAGLTIQDKDENTP